DRLAAEERQRFEPDIPPKPTFRVEPPLLGDRHFPERHAVDGAGEGERGDTKDQLVRLAEPRCRRRVKPEGGVGAFMRAEEAAVEPGFGPVAGSSDVKPYRPAGPVIRQVDNRPV